MLLYEARRSVDPAGADLLGVHLEREVDEVDDRQRPASMACAVPHRVWDIFSAKACAARRRIIRTPPTHVTTPKTLMNAKSLSLSFRNFSFNASCSASMRACVCRVDGVATCKDRHFGRRRAPARRASRPRSGRTFRTGRRRGRHSPSLPGCRGRSLPDLPWLLRLWRQEGAARQPQSSQPAPRLERAAW